MTQCYLIHMNHSLPTSIMILRYVSPTILVYLNQVAGICLCYWTYAHVSKSLIDELTLKLHKKIKKIYMLGFYKAIYQNNDQSTF